MYEVYSEQQPGRPLWTMAASAVILLLSTGMAALLIRERAGPSGPVLGSSQVYPSGELTARLPSGWEPESLDPSVPGVVVKVAEPVQSGGRPGRELVVFRGLPEPMGVPSRDSVPLVIQMARLICGGSEPRHYQTEPGLVGGLPGWTVGRLSVETSGQQAWPTYCLGRAAVAPAGDTVGVLLVLHRREAPREADLRLLDDICNQTELTDAPLHDPAKAMASAGVRFKVPQESTFVANVDQALPRVRLTGGEGATWWFLDVSRVPLIGSRAPQDLVEDQALSILQRVDLPEPVETTKIAGREAAQVALAVPLRADPTLYLVAAKTDPHTALLIAGRHERNAGPTLRKICQSIIETAEVEDYDRLVDTKGARQNAREWLAQAGKGELSAAWARYEGLEQQFVIRSPAMVWGGKLKTYHRSRQDGTDWWTIVVQTRLRPSASEARTTREEWRIREDGTEYEFSMRRLADRRVELEYQERRGQASKGLDRELRLLTDGQVSKRDGQVQVEEPFACEPVLLAAGAHAAKDPQRRAMLFNTCEPLTSRTAWWLIVPLGQASPPGGGLSGVTRAVRLHRDDEPSPITLYYDASDTLVGVYFDHREWHEWVKPAKEGHGPS